MENPLVKGYVALDNAIMYGVNKAVHGWNWTTGDTKAGLANKLLTVEPVLESVGCFIINIPLGIISSLFMPAFSHICQKNNTNQEALEQKAIDSGAIDLNILLFNRNNTIVGHVYGALSGGSIICAYSEKNETPEGSALLGAGYAIRSLSHYVMRSDFLPPKKSCFERGWEKLESLVKDYRNKPALAPVLELERVRW